MMAIRNLHPEELPLLDSFLYEAIFIPEGVSAPPRSIIESEDLQVYVRDFGRRPDDRCLVAEVDGKVVGIVWTRIMDDYGQVSQFVQKANYALRMYEKAGFWTVADRGEERLMICKL